MRYNLRDLANVIRSKNAGPYELTLDVMLKDEETFRMVRDAGIFNKKNIAALYQTKEEDVIGIVYFPNAYAVKATIVRPIPSGAIGERDVYGAQQHAPLMDFTFEWNG
jgi:hypothetical protein